MSTKQISCFFIFLFSMVGLSSCSLDSKQDESNEEKEFTNSASAEKNLREKADTVETDSVPTSHSGSALLDFYFSEKPEFGSFSPLVYKSKSYEKTSSYIDTANNGDNDQTKAQVKYPSFQDEWVNERIKTVFFEGKTPEENADDFIQHFEEIYHESLEDKDFGVSALMMPWEQTQDISIDYETAKFITLQLDFYSYTGGAHGLPALVYKVFDKTDKRALTLEDIIQKEKSKDFVDLSKELFKKEKNITSDQNLFKEYDFTDGNFYLPDNFGMEKEGLVFLYGVYEIKPFADGFIQFTVPYTYLKKFLTKKGLSIIYEDRS